MDSLNNLDTNNINLDHISQIADNAPSNNPYSSDDDSEDDVKILISKTGKDRIDPKDYIPELESDRDEGFDV